MVDYSMAIKHIIIGTLDNFYAVNHITERIPTLSLII